MVFDEENVRELKVKLEVQRELIGKAGKLSDKYGEELVGSVLEELGREDVTGGDF